jgi:hypothetical protein
MPRNHKRRLSTTAILIAIAIVAITTTTMSPTSAKITDVSVKYNEFRESRAKPRNYITQLIFEMEHSLDQLKAKDLTISKLEEMAVFIYESMSIATRNYHSVQHVFGIIGHDVRLKDNSIAILAACFHDCIYYHLDGGLTPRMATLLKGSFEVTDPDIEQHDDSDYINAQHIYKFSATDRETGMDDKHLQMVETIFGYTSGQNLRFAGDGLNEFLSALVAVRMLKDHLPMEILAQIACCIEATIPFINADKETGKTHMDKLHDNMKKVKEAYNLELSDEDLVKSVQVACLLSNSDVENFGSTDRLWFLDCSWNLLTEQNVSLRNEHVYSVDHFLAALYGTFGFYGFLQPAVVFHEFQGVPAASEMETLMQECKNNLEFGRTYVGAKVVAMSLVSALAILTGGDAPISLFTGDLRMKERRSDVMTCPPSPLSSRMPEETSQHPPNECLESCTDYVYEILAEGRRSESSFDTKRSPWAALLYGYLGDEGLNRILKEHTLYPMTPEKAWILLRALPPKPVNIIVQSISKQAPSRADRISEIISQL